MSDKITTSDPTVISEETVAANEETVKQAEAVTKKKKKNPVAAFFKFLFTILLTLIVILAIWCTFSALDRKKSLALLPQNYSAYLHTDSLYDSINPMLDLQAADIYLASDSMSDIRGIFMMLRASELRNNRFVKSLAARKVDAAFYAVENIPDTFIATIDFGVFSAATRLANFIIPKIPYEGLSRVQAEGLDYFKYVNGNNIFYFKPVKNLIVVSNNFDYFKESLKEGHDQGYSEQQLELLNKKTEDPVKVIVDAKNLAKSFTKDNPMLQKMTSIISDKSLSIVSFKITDNEISFNVEIPVDAEAQVKADRSLEKTAKLFSKNSTAPDLISRMSSSVQYYTVLNAGTLDELLDAVIPLMGNQDISGLLKTADDLCHSIFKLSLDDILYSWTDTEYAVMGIEGLNDPVFAIKISDERKRKEVFDGLLNSILLTENKSLILNGVRIPRIELPQFLQKLLKLFKIDLPKPYYLVYNNYIYFSQSAETISAVYSTFANSSSISFNQNWKEVSKGLSKEASVSLFYDLERSRPFFITSNSSLSQILELYSIGRTDFEIKDNSILFNLTAISRRAGSLKNIPGFPMELTGKTDNKLFTGDVKRPENIFWLENGQTLKSFNVNKTQGSSYELPAKAIIQGSNSGDSEKVVALTQQKELYVFNEKLEVEKGYPVKLPSEVLDTPYLTAKTSFIPTTNRKFIKVEDRRVSTIDFGIDDLEAINTNSWYDGKRGVIYERGFIGKLYALSNGKCINKTEPVIIDKLGFGVPAVSEEEDHVFYIGFIAQSGELYIWRVDGEFIYPHVQTKLDGVYFTNLVKCGKYFYALSAIGEVTRIDYRDGSTLSVQIDNVTAKEGAITVRKYNEINYLCITIDGNRIYAFTENLELLSGFPVAAHGVPVLADVNGDKYPDCFALTIDGKLNAWNLR